MHWEVTDETGRWVHGRYRTRKSAYAQRFGSERVIRCHYSVADCEARQTYRRESMPRIMNWQPGAHFPAHVGCAHS